MIFKNSFNKIKKIDAFFIVTILMLFYFFIKVLITKYDKSSWQISEFLINYEGGFVRRGLLGQILFLLDKNFGIHPYYIIIFISVICYILLVQFFITAFKNKKFTLVFFPFVFFLGYPIINNTLIRKDTLIILLFLYALKIYHENKKAGIFLVNLLLVIAILIHEGIAFFSLPILLFYCYNRTYKKQKKLGISLVITFVNFLPSIFTFILVSIYKGSKEIAQIIWNSWENVYFPYQIAENDTPPGAIESISWSFKYALGITNQYIFKNGNNGIYAPFMWLTVIIIIYFILINTDKIKFKIFAYSPKKDINPLILSNVLLFQLIALLPLFIVAIDYGRWIFYWTISSMAIVAIIKENYLITIFPKVLNRASMFILNKLNRKIIQKPIFLLCVLIGFHNSYWSIENFVKTSWLYLFYYSISDIFFSIYFIVSSIL